MSDKNKNDVKPNKPDGKEDEELAELLDSALEDFKKGAAETPETLTSKESSGSGGADNKSIENQSAKSESGKSEQELDEAIEQWDEQFIKEACSQFENHMAGLLGAEAGQPASQEQFQERFMQMADAAKQVLQNPGQTTEGANDFAATISQTLQGLNQGTANLSSLEGDMMNMFSNQSGQDSFLPFMQGMMQSLLSKDILYPSLKDIIDRYPAWFEENKDKITPEERQQYENQQKLMTEICQVLDTEKPDESEDVKSQRFEKVLGLMQKLQEYGQPPKDLVGDVGPSLPDLGNPTDPSQCSVM